MQETQETRALSRGWEERLEEEMAAHSRIPAGKTPWVEELRGPQSIWSPRAKATEHNNQQYTLLYRKQVTNKDLVYSTGNSTQWPKWEKNLKTG